MYSDKLTPLGGLSNCEADCEVMRMTTVLHNCRELQSPENWPCKALSVINNPPVAK